VRHLLFVIASPSPSRHCEALSFRHSEALPPWSLQGSLPLSSLRGTSCRSNLEVSYYARISSANPRKHKLSSPLGERIEVRGKSNGASSSQRSPMTCLPPFVIARHPVPKQSRGLLVCQYSFRQVLGIQIFPFLVGGDVCHFYPVELSSASLRNWNNGMWE